MSAINKTYIILPIALILASPLHAQIVQPKSKGMNYIKITKSPSENDKEARDEIKEDTKIESHQEQPSKKEQDEIIAALEKPLLEKKKQADIKKRELNYFTPKDKLEKWPYLKALISSSLETKATAIIELEKAPEKASPMVLLLASEFYFKQNQKEKAALYFLASKLRAKFDMQRWAIINESGIEARKKPHPASETISLSRTMSKELSGWILSKKARGQVILNGLKAWEEKTNYSYLPTYELTNSDFKFMDNDKLIDAHKKHLENFIKEQNNILTLIHP